MNLAVNTAENNFFPILPPKASGSEYTSYPSSKPVAVQELKMKMVRCSCPNEKFLNFMMITKFQRKSSMGILQGCWVLFWTNPGSSTLRSSSFSTTYLLLHKTFNLDEKDMLGTAGEVRVNSTAMFSNDLLHMDMPSLADQQELTFIVSMQTLFAI